VARIGGEEFAMLLPHHTADEARTQAERCVAALQAAALEHGDSPVAACVTLSIGGAHVPASGAAITAAELLRQADAALYEAKQGGRNRVVMR
jgi:diguanylate cyclase (GGDEF)-like protein